MLDPDCLPLARAYQTTTGKRSTNFVQLAMKEPHLTLDLDYIQWHNYKNMPHNTCFKEITVIKPDSFIGPRLKTVLELEPKIEKNIDIISNNIFEALKDFYRERWDSNREHVFLLSSGMDSRISSQALASVRDENGKDWLGNVLFVCHQPECDSFKAVMRAQGWKESQYYCFREDRSLVDYFSDIADFDRCWQWSHGYSSIWFGLFHLIVKEVIQLGLVDEHPKNIDVFANTCGDTITVESWGRLLQIRKKQHSQYPYLDAVLSFLRERYAGFRESIMLSHYNYYFDPYTWYKVFECAKQLPLKGVPKLREIIINKFGPVVGGVPLSQLSTSHAYQFSQATLDLMNKRYSESEFSNSILKKTIKGHYDITPEALVFDTYLYSLGSLYEKLYEMDKIV